MAARHNCRKSNVGRSASQNKVVGFVDFHGTRTTLKGILEGIAFALPHVERDGRRCLPSV